MGRIERILRKHRIRRMDAAQVHAVLAEPPMVLQRALVEAAGEHALLLLPRLHLLHQQRADIAGKLEEILETMPGPDAGEGETVEHRDAEVILSLPGIGTHIAATMLSEAWQALAERDCHALRCYAGAVPKTYQSGRKKAVRIAMGATKGCARQYIIGRGSVSCATPKSKPGMRKCVVMGTLMDGPCEGSATVGWRC